MIDTPLDCASGLCELGLFLGGIHCIVKHLRFCPDVPARGVHI